MKITLLHQDKEYAEYMLGQVPLWLNENALGTAAEQINKGYAFGGWQPLPRTTLGEGNTMCYPGDPPQKPIAMIEFRNEKIFAYPSEFWGIVQADGTASFARLD